MDASRWDAWLERVILGLVAFALGLGILAFGGVRLQEFLLIEGLTGLCLVVWLVRIVSVRGHRILWPPVCWGVLVFAIWAVWRTAAADLEYPARGELFRILTYTALFFVIVNNLHRQETAQRLSWWLIGLATLLCFYGAWQFATANNSVWGLSRAEDYLHRASGSYACPNHFAGLLEMLIPVALTILIAGRMKALGRVLLAYCVLVMLAGLVLTFSRGGWIAAGAGIVFVLVILGRHRDYRWPALICLAAVLIAGGIAATRTDVMQKRLQSSHDLNPHARNSRPNIWRAAIGMWRDHPWLGVGPAHFGERFKQYRTHWAHGEPVRAHNDYLNALADWGVIGTTLAAIPWFLLGYGIWRTLRQVARDPGDFEAKRSGRYGFVLGATGGLVALLTHSAVDFNFHIPANAMLAVTWMGLLAGYSRYATDDWWLSSRRPWRLFVVLLLIAPLLAALVWDLSRRGLETYHLQRATELRQTEPASDAELGHLQAAWRVEPDNAWTAFHLGEIFRLRSFTGLPGYEARALEALEWYRIAAEVNPYQPAFRFTAGRSLDWLGQHEQARDQYDAALKLDPEGRITSFFFGRHELEMGNLEAARQWFIKSVSQGWPPYAPAVDYLRIVEERARDITPIPAPEPPATP
jgi:O-antigen ligase